MRLALNNTFKTSRERIFSVFRLPRNNCDLFALSYAFAPFRFDCNEQWQDDMATVRGTIYEWPTPLTTARAAAVTSPTSQLSRQRLDAN